jgi:hypothetical protein
VEHLEPVAHLLDDGALLDAALAGGGAEAEDAFALEVLGDGAVGADPLEAEAVRRGAPLEVAPVGFVGEGLFLQLADVELDVVGVEPGAGVVPDLSDVRFEQGFGFRVP